MKTVLLLAACALAAPLVLFAQAPPSLDAKADGYRAGVHWVKRVWYAPAGGSNEPDRTSAAKITSRTNQLIEYDKDGRLRTFTTFLPGSDDREATTERYLWKDGRLARRTLENVSYEVIQTTVYTYDAQGRESRRETAPGPGDKMGFAVYEQVESTWEGDRLVKTVHRNKSGGVIKEVVYTHDAQGRVVREDYKPAGLYSAVTYTYDAQGRKTGETFLNKAGEPARVNTIVYGSVGKPIKRTSTAYYNGQKTEEEVTLTTYGDRGDPKSQQTKKNGQVTAEYRWENSYDLRGDRVQIAHIVRGVPELIETVTFIN